MVNIAKFVVVVFALAFVAFVLCLAVGSATRVAPSVIAEDSEWGFHE